MLTQDHLDAGIVLVRQINPLEALVKWKSDDVKYAYQNYEGGLTVGARPCDHHTYVIKMEGKGMTSALFHRGFNGLCNHKGMPLVITTTFIVHPERYALKGDNLIALTEAEVEAIPGVEKCIYEGFFRSPEARFVYQDGQLLYEPEE